MGTQSIHPRSNGIHDLKANLTWLLITLLSLVFLPACTPKEAPKTGVVLGVIYDSQSNEVLADVKVNTGTALFTTSSSRGVFESSVLPYGPLTLTFEKTGYKTTQRMLDLAEGKVFLQVLLERNQSIALTTTDGVKLRSAPQPEADILAVLPNSAKLVLSKEITLGWYRVQFEGKDGWVWGGYLRSSDVKIASMMTTQELKVMSEAGGGDELGAAYAGLGLIVLEEKNGWTKVLLPTGLEGWVEVKNLTQ